MLREQRGWSRRELSRRCGIGEAQIGKYESNQSDITATNLKIIADEFGVSIDYLLGASDVLGRTMGDITLSKDEQDLITTLRHDGWIGIIHLGAERVANELSKLER